MSARLPVVVALAACASCAAHAVPKHETVPPVIATPVAVERAASPKGSWLATIRQGSEVTKAQFRISPDAAACSMDFLDRNIFGYACRFSQAPDGSVAIELTPALKWTGVLAHDGNSMTGAWTQASEAVSPAMTREAVPIERPKAPMEPALPAINLASLKAVLDADMAPSLARGELASSTGGGVVIGVVHHGVRKVFAYGAVWPDSIFEIGSISKTFTGLLLAQMVQQKQARLDEPIRDLLPAGVVSKPATGPEVTLLDLSDQHSGLPRMPDNFQPADGSNPYADYDEKALFAWLAKQGVARSPDAPYGYSNVGVGLLGDALARRAGATYEALLHDEVTGPLGMTDTAIAFTPSQRARVAVGHDFQREPTHAWDYVALGGAGAIRSTAGDMLTYLEAQLHPEALPPAVSRTVSGKTLGVAITESHVIRARCEEGVDIALNWFRSDATGAFSHDGQTGGYTSVAKFVPASELGIVVLSNTTADTEFVDRIRDHVEQRLKGVVAVSIARPPLP